MVTDNSSYKHLTTTAIWLFFYLSVFGMLEISSQPSPASRYLYQNPALLKSCYFSPSRNFDFEFSRKQGCYKLVALYDLDYSERIGNYNKYEEHNNAFC